MLTDVLTAVTITWYLRRLKTGYKNADTLVNKLIVYAVSRFDITLGRNEVVAYARTLPGQYRVGDQCHQRSVPRHLRDNAGQLYLHLFVLRFEQTCVSPWDATQETPTNHVLIAVYANSFLATLNTRLVLKGRGTDNAHETVPTFLMVDTRTIPPLPRQESDEVYSPCGKVCISTRILLVAINMLTFIPFI